MSETSRPATAGAAAGQRAPRRRLVGLDVTRAVALIGVVVMNYHGYLNRGDDGPDRSWAERLFDPWQGPMSTRFAATFVLVAGMGVTLLTARSVASGDVVAITHDRMRLLRRGAALYVGGWLLDKHWSGTILFFYGAYFMIAAGLFTLRSRWLVLIGSIAAIAGAAIDEWSLMRILDGESTGWLNADPDSPRGLLLRTFVNHTHPVLPWLAFLCAGIVLGRHLDRLATLRPLLIGIGLSIVGLTYVIRDAGPSGEVFMMDRGDQLVANALSTHPFDRGLLYTIGTLATAVVAFCLISAVADRWPDAWPVDVLRRAGQMTLSLYLLHVLVYKVLVDNLHWVRRTGLDTALLLAFVFWVVAIAAAAVWQKRLGQGPAERLYRWIGG